jgi:hypothetical protein
MSSGGGTELFANYESDFQLTYSEIVQKLEEVTDLPAGEGFFVGCLTFC